MYIVAIMITALVFSATGLGVLELGRTVTEQTQTATNIMQTQIELESFVNVALWKLNTGADSLASFSSGAYSSSYDSTTQVLSVIHEDEQGITGYALTLEEDDHFHRAVAASGTFLDMDHALNEEPEHRSRDDFLFLPAVDTSFWISNADSIYTDHDRVFHDNDLMNGILVFTGDELKFDDIDLENTTMVIMGHDVEFRRNNTVRAFASGSTVFPALVFTDTSSTFYLSEFFSYRQDRIEGAIYSAGTLIIQKGQLTGPLVAKHVVLWQNIDLLDDEYAQYYQWPQGFGARSAYDWPKQIALWTEY